MRLYGHPRSGTHFVADLLSRNFTGVESKLPDQTAPFDWDIGNIGVLRDCLPTMLSMWEVRDYYGIARDMTLTDFLTTPYYQMPRSDGAAGYLLGVPVFKPVTRLLTTSWMTPPQHWLHYQKHVWWGCNYAARLPDIVGDPVAYLAEVAWNTGQEIPDNVLMVHHQFGFQPAVRRLTILDGDHLAICGRYQDRFNVWSRKRFKRRPYDTAHYKFVETFRKQLQERKPKPTATAKKPKPKPRRPARAKAVVVKKGVTRIRR